MNENVLELVNPQSKHLAFKWSAFKDGTVFSGVTRFNYFSVILVLEGRGTVAADVSVFPFAAKSLLCFFVGSRRRCGGRVLRRWRRCCRI
jgi:AraC family transcriptional regulator, transcriptional activator of pobA